MTRAAVAAGVVAAVVGFATDTGEPPIWLVVIAFVGLIVGIVCLGSDREDLLLAEAALVVVAVAAGGLLLWAWDLRDAAEEARADAATTREALGEREETFDFVVFEGEGDPESIVSGPAPPSEWVYPRVSPGLGARAADDRRVRVGTHVEVICHVDAGGIRWYRLATGGFLYDAVVRLEPHSGQTEPPTCPPQPAIG